MGCRLCPAPGGERERVAPEGIKTSCCLVCEKPEGQLCEKGGCRQDCQPFPSPPPLALDHVDAEQSVSRDREMLLPSSLTKHLLTSSLISMPIMPRETIWVTAEGSLYPRAFCKRLSVAIPLESSVFKVCALLNSLSRAKALWEKSVLSLRLVC